MGLFVTILIMVIIVLAMVIALGFANAAAASITKITTATGKWKDVPELRSAHSYLTWLSVAGWITIALIITGIVLFFVFGGEFVEGAEEAESVEKSLTKKGGKKGNFMLDAVLFLAAGITITIGIISAMAARDLRKAQGNSANGISASDDAYSKAYTDTIIAASLGIGTVGLLILVMIIHASAKHAAKTSQLKKEEARKEKIKEAHEEKVKEQEEHKEELLEEKQNAAEERREEAEERKLELQQKKAELAQQRKQLEETAAAK